QSLFVCASSVVAEYKTAGDQTLTAAPGQGQKYLGGATGITRLPRMGIFAALDPTTNTLRWRYQWSEECYSGSPATRGAGGGRRGARATGGGLVCVGRNDARLTAPDSPTGKQLWEFQTGAGMHAGASTFERGGKQYVLAYSAGNALIGSASEDR